MPEPQFENQATPQALKKVRPIPGFEEYAPEAAFGGGKERVGAAIGEAARTAGELYDQHANDMAFTLAQGKITDAQEYKRKLLEEPNKGYKQLHGEDALHPENYETYKIDFSNYTDQLLATAKSGRERRFLEKEFAKETNDFTKQMQDHQHQEAENLRLVNTIQSNVSLIREAQSHIGEDDAIKDYQNKAMANALRVGGDPLKTLDEMNFGIANKMIQEKNWPLAQKFYTENYFSEGHAKLIQDAVEKGQQHNQAVNTADEIFKRNKGNLDDAIDEVDNKNLPPDQAEAVKKEIRTKAKNIENDKKLTVAHLYQNSFDAVSKAVQASGGKIVDPKSIVDSTTWQQLPKKDQDALYALSDPTKTKDPHRFSEFLSLGEKVADIDSHTFYSEWYPYMDATMQKDAEKLWKSYHPTGKGSAEANARFAAPRMLQNRLREINPKLDKDYTKWPDAAKKNYFQLQQRTDRVIYDQMLIEGKSKLSDQEISEVVDNQIKHTFYHQGFMGTRMGGGDRPNYQMQIDDVPKSEQSRMRALTDKPLSDDQVIRLFQAYKLGGQDAKVMMNQILKETK